MPDRSWQTPDAVGLGPRRIMKRTPASKMSLSEPSTRIPPSTQASPGFIKSGAEIGEPKRFDGDERTRVTCETLRGPALMGRQASDLARVTAGAFTRV